MPRPKTRNQLEKRKVILEAALEIFSENGLRGATLEMIATQAGLSKQNLIYYVPTKEALYVELLEGQLDAWLQPLRDIDAAGDPQTEILTYVRRKLTLSETMPRESRLFATEMLQNAPRLSPVLSGRLRALVDEKAAILAGWARDGRIAPLDPHHLIFAIWSMTQHYADFDVQISAVLGPDRAPRRHREAEAFVTAAILRIIDPAPLAHDGGAA
ncbi:TetR family transcriptional regulator C-terminal domain-containing protein [Falsirhodobacter algicola]|nr:TetR family transcriptional regulator C-terminal domain-containing protein [Falsirhodobacter algicola]